MLIDSQLIANLILEAAANPRLRTNLDLRTSSEDSSQRMLNALHPGTVVPIHRHRGTTETVVCLHGSMIEIFYDTDGLECSRYELSKDGPVQGLQIPAGQWHTALPLTPCVIFEAKDGPFQPFTQEDLWSDR